MRRVCSALADAIRGLPELLRFGYSCPRCGSWFLYRHGCREWRVPFFTRPRRAKPDGDLS